MEYKVSIIVPIYNINSYLQRCVDSILAQTHSNIEIILVDDGSTDGSENICDEYSLKDDRIKVIHKNNAGLSSARNTGLDVAQGEYFLFIDGDDYISRYTVEQTLKIATEYVVDMVQFRYKEVCGTEKAVDDNNSVSNVKVYSDTKEFFDLLYTIGGEAASACTKLYHYSIFKDLRYEEGIIHEDEYMITRLLPRIGKIAYCDDEFYFYVMRPGSTIKSSFSIKKLDSLFVIEDRIEFLKKQGYSELLDKEYARYYMAMISLYSDAKQVECKEACKIILDKLIKVLPTIIRMKCIFGKYKFLAYLMRVNIKFLDVFCFYRKIG